MNPEEFKKKLVEGLKGRDVVVSLEDFIMECDRAYKIGFEEGKKHAQSKSSDNGGSGK